MKIELAYPWTDEDGKQHKPDSAVTVSDEVGTQLIADGRARASQPPAAAPKAAETSKGKANG